MRWQTLMLIGVAMGCGMLASMFVANLTGARPPEVVKEETKRIYVALRDLRDGERLDERNVKLVQWPARALPPGVVEQLDELKSRQVAGPITAGQPIQVTQFQSDSTSETPAVAPAVPEAPRTFAVEIPAGGAGPWVVSTDEPLKVTSLADVWRDAIEVARRSTPDPVPPVARSEKSSESRDQATQSPVHESTPTEPVAAELPSVTTGANPAELSQDSNVPRRPWMSTIITPEGAKVLRWRSAEPSPPVTSRGGDGSRSRFVKSSPNASTLSSGPACDLVGRTLAGQPFSFEAFRGRPTLLVVYQARSAAMREELSLVERLIAQHEAQGLQVVAVALDEDVEAVRSFAQRNQLAWTHVVGAEAIDWARQSQLDTSLALVIVDQDGRMQAVGRQAQQVAPMLATICANHAQQPSAREARRAEAGVSQP